jgi:phosphatidate cytidylyltransferase
MKRIATAVVLIPIFLYLMLWAPFWAFATALALVALLCYWEFGGIIAAHGIPQPGITGALIGILVLFAPANSVLIAPAIGLVGLTVMLRCPDLREALPAAGALALAIVYIFGAWRCAAALRLISPALLFFAVALNWAGDTAAMYAGRTFGRHKLAPRISPGKTVEGSIASVAASVIFGLLYFHWVLPAAPLWWAAALAIAGNVAGQIGDLAESALKRGAGLKDSGAMLPGHGGWLDRVDSSLFAAPVVYALVLGASSRFSAY